MQFREIGVTNRKTHTSAQVWLPEMLSVRSLRDETAEHVVVKVGQASRAMATASLRMAAEFTADLSRHERLGHDCGVFALACVSGNPFQDQVFNRAGGLVVKIGSHMYSAAPPEAQLEEPDTEPGAVVFTANADPIDPDFFKVGPHLLVRATADEGTPLYLSKFGTEGRVLLSDLEQAMSFYPTKTVGIAADLYTEDYETAVQDS